ncbi:MAG: flagellar motor switch protein FliN [Bacillota bacterium]|jgi:flagellar motor switch protein FliN/FliY|nr:flagellar motor switch protein FliN [Bacillota bacterium]
MTIENIFSDMERDVIGEVMNISLGSSATSLSTLLGKRVEITVPKVKVIDAGNFSFEDFEPAIGVEIKYVEGLDGINLMILKKFDAKAIVEILMGQDIPDEEFQMDEITTSALCEVMNQMMGSSATALADFLGKTINISTPRAYEIEDETAFKSKYFQPGEVIVTVSFDLNIEGSVQSEFINVMTLDLSREIVSMFLKGTGMFLEENDSVDNGEEEVVSKENIEYIISGNNTENKKEINNQSQIKQEGLKEYKEEVHVKRQKPQVQQRIRDQIPVSVKPMEYENFDDYEEEEIHSEQLSNLELIKSVPLEISVEIGKTKKPIKEILEFSNGTIIELDKQAGALVDIVVNGQLIAKGEVVVVNDNFGVRVVEILKKDEIIRMTL